MLNNMAKLYLSNLKMCWILGLGESDMYKVANYQEKPYSMKLINW